MSRTQEAHEPNNNNIGDYGRMVGPNRLRFERRLTGPSERVWSYLTEPAKLGTWLATATYSQLRVGNVAELIWDHSKLSSQQEPAPEKYRDLQGKVTRWRVTRLEAPRALSVVWDEGTDAASDVSFELKPSGSDTLLVLTHSRLKNVPETASSWHVHLDILGATLAGRAPRPFWSRHKQLEAEYQQRMPQSAPRR